jgi:hypothetical protein
MAQTNTDVRVNITAESKQAKAAINDIARSLSALGKTAKGTTSTAGQLNTSVGDLAKGFVVGTLAAQGIKMALNFVKQEFINCVKESVNYTNALIGLSSVSAAFGESQSTARDAAVSLAQDGLMSVTEAADGLKNLLATGFSLDEAINLMKGFKDAAAFNRQGTLEFGQAIVGATQGIKNQNSIMVDNVGITKNLSNILKEAGLSVDDLSNVTSDASVRQKLYNGLMKEASVFQGDAGRAADTLGGRISTLQTMFKMARVEVGDALSPALSALMADFMKVANVAGSILLPIIKGVITVFYGATTAARLLGNTISGVFATLFAIPEAIKTKSLDPLKNTFKVVGQDYGNILEKAGEDIANIWGGSVKDVGRSAVEGLGNTSKAVSEKAAKLAKDLKKENEDYISDISKMTSSFQESLNDLIFAHRDKKKQLEKDMADENKSYEKRMGERTDKYNADLVDMEETHKEKLKSIQADIVEEEKSLIESEKKKEAFQDDKYLADIDRSRVKLEELKFELDQENSEYEKQAAETKSIYQKETEEIKEEYNERLNNLREELNVEINIYKQYEGEFNALKDKVAEDDITRLKRKFAEEKAEREKDHQEKLAELYAQGAAETAARESGQQKKSASTTSNAITQAVTEAKETIKKYVAPKAWGETSTSFATGAKTSVYASTPWYMPSFAEGGVVQGQLGQPVIAQVHAGEEVIPINERSSKGNVTNNINVNVGIYAGSVIEKRNLALQFWQEVGRLANSQNKTPTQLLGFSGA